MANRVLILAGTSEAAALARRASELEGLSVITSLAGRTRKPGQLAGQLRVGGFGGAAGLCRYLIDERIDALVDATHPFARQISCNAWQAAREAGVDRLALCRPAWTPQPTDRWSMVADLQSAARALEPHQRTFVTVGRQELDVFASRPDVWLLARVIDPPETPPSENMRIISGRGPFTLSEECRLLVEHRIDCLVTKNSGGTASYAKLIAARQKGIRVIMIERPAPVPGPTAQTVDEALTWLATIANT